MEFFQKYFPKKWFVYLIGFTVIWYPLTLVVTAMLEFFYSQFTYVIAVSFRPLLLLLFAYLYFSKKVINDWTARFITAILWPLITLLIAAALVKPVFGYHWSSILHWGVMTYIWMDLAAIIVGGFVAQKPRIPPPLPPEVKK